jgi:hypothetical protein
MVLVYMENAMNHGGLGYLDSQRLVLPIDILRPLSIYDGSHVLCLYYPPPEGPGYEGVPWCHDFMITPAPLRYWPLMGRLLIRLWHRPDSMRRVSHWLADNGITILTDECSRSAHRYATWNLTIAFDSISGANRFNKRTSEHVRTHKALSKLVKDLNAAFPDDDVLFRDPNDRHLRTAIEAMPTRAHSYFYNYYLAHKAEPWREPVELFCMHSELQSTDHRLAVLLEILANGGEELTPTCVFAEMDTRDFNIRVALIPPAELCRYFEIVVPYRRIGNKSSRGLMATIAERLGGNYNFWRLHSSTSQDHSDIESGEVFLCLEDRRKKIGDPLTYRRELENVLADLAGAQIGSPTNGIKILKPSLIMPVTPERVRERLTRERKRDTGREYDVFISYGKGDGLRSAHAVKQCLENLGLRTHLDEAVLQAGDDWLTRLIKGIESSAEVAVVCTKRSLERQWIALEIGCALSQGKAITPILCGNIEESKIPEYLRRFQWVDRAKDPGLQSYGKLVRERIARESRF